MPVGWHWPSWFCFGFRRGGAVRNRYWGYSFSWLFSGAWELAAEAAVAVVVVVAVVEAGEAAEILGRLQGRIRSPLREMAIPR